MFPTLMNEQRHRKRHVLLPILSAASLKHAMPHSPFFHLLLALAHVHRTQLAPLERRQRYYRDTSAYISDPIYPLVPIHLCVSAANNRERASRAQRPRKGPCSAFEAESTHFSKDIKIRTRAVAAKGIVTTRLTTLTVSPLATCPSHGAASIHKSAAAARRRFHGAIFETHGLEPFEGEGTLRVCCFVLLIRTDARAAGV